MPLHTSSVCQRMNSHIDEYGRKALEVGKDECTVVVVTANYTPDGRESPSPR